MTKNYIRAFLLILALNFFLVTPVHAIDETGVAQQILASFGSSCPSQGFWTQNALSQSLSLIATLNALKDEKGGECGSVNGALTQLQSLSSRITQISAKNVGYQLNALQNSETSYMLSLASTTDPLMKSQISSGLTSIESTLASFYGNSSRATTAINETNALTDFTMGTQVALSQLIANQTCVLHHPQILTGVASLAASITSGLLTSGASLATSAGVSIINSAVEFVRIHKLQKKINKLVGPVALASFECAIESISNNWCSAQDALNVINFKEQSLAAQQNNLSPPPQTNFLQALSLLDKDLPLFLDWLNQVRAGNQPTTPPEGDRQGNEFSKNADVQKARAYAQGIFNDGQRIFDQHMPADPKGAWSYERTLITQFMSKIGASDNPYASMSGNNTPSPLFDIYPVSCAGYVLLGLTERSQWLFSQMGTCEPLSNFDPFGPDWKGAKKFVPDLQALKDNAEAWVKLAEANTSDEMSNVLQADGRSVFEDAQILNVDGRSPLTAIQNFIQFLSSQPGLPGDYSQGTKEKLIGIQKEIEAVIANGQDPDNSVSKAALQKIYTLAQLAYGPTYFQGRLERVIRRSLTNVVLDPNSGVNEATSAQLIAAENIIAQLQKIRGNTSFALMKKDIGKAQELSEAALATFMEMFAENLSSGLSSYDVSAGQDAGSEKYKTSKAALCLLLLSAPKWPEKIPSDFCVGEQIPAEMAGGPASAKIEKSTFDLPHEKRACLYRDYLRLSDIYQFQASHPVPSTSMKKVSP